MALYYNLVCCIAL
ncbi:unnamed protein product [Kuraishia capsulata CBS 1993]|uniref:Uncharacterized protein n=1 Tax=Kuraishia capsulata CBS 1993 TaxID=1382522 RepID=W6MFP7_9ASCO|nr:unnamed protein product [Kuraishia capsulata CBS 1993]